MMQLRNSRFSAFKYAARFILHRNVPFKGLKKYFRTFDFYFHGEKIHLATKFAILPEKTTFRQIPSVLCRM